MPHITIEYSSNVAEQHDIDSLVGVVHEAALATGVPPPDGLRTRAVARDHYRIADGQPDHAFIAITIRVGPGRAPEVKTGLLNTVLDAAEAELDQAQPTSESGSLAIAWSIELQEIDAAMRINRNHVRTRMQETS